MDVFAFREELVAEYERFSRSFTNIRTEDVSREVDAAYAGGRFWPTPLIQLNPNFEPGAYVDDVLRRKRSGDACKGITAIVFYPMNALCNSQREELEKYLRLCLGSEINWTRPGPISVSAESSAAGLLHVLPTAPRPSQAGGAVGKKCRNSQVAWLTGTARRMR